MVKLYKTGKDGKLLQVEYWFKDNKAIIHTGKVGYTGKEEICICQDKEDFDASFKKKYYAEGYAEFAEENYYWLAIQFPIKSLAGSERDHWLRDKVSDYLNHELGWKGLGHIDGFDMGKTMNPVKQFALNIYACVVDEEKGISMIKSTLKEYRLDYTQIKIASRRNNDDTYKLKYSAKKKDTEFYL